MYLYKLAVPIVNMVGGKGIIPVSIMTVGVV